MHSLIRIEIFVLTHQTEPQPASQNSAQNENKANQQECKKNPRNLEENVVLGRTPRYSNQNVIGLQPRWLREDLYHAQLQGTGH